MVELTTVEYGGWQTNHKLTNGIIDLIITGEVGPRIIHFGFVGGENRFYTNAAELGKRGGNEWSVFGGHRFWHAPEHLTRTYQPDNDPIVVKQFGDIVRVEQPVERGTGMAKSLDIHMSADAAHVRVTHRLTNTNLWAVTCAPWALSVMASGGLGIIPLPPRRTHAEELLPANTLTLWHYTNMADPRWTWGEKYILLRQDAQAKTPQKIGAYVPDGWVAHARGGRVFLKLFDHQANATYPDMNASVELFTDSNMLEVETLGSVRQIDPGSSIEHTEDWFLFKDVLTPISDEHVDRNILPLVNDARGMR